jgi:3',5'-cyclic AMP phosphodiesterase CpdA
VSGFLNRRAFLRNGSAAVLAASIPVTQVEIAFAKETDNFSFAVISDAHMEQIQGSVFVRNWDRGLIRAVAETGLLNPAPDFVIFGGDLAERGTRAELDHGAEILSRLRPPVHYVMGEHDYYLDLGEYWSRLFGHQWYSFDHKGVHFVVLNSVLTYDDWTLNRWPTAEQRMREIGTIDGPNGSPFMVGEKQRAWLGEDLRKVRKQTPVVVVSHAPLQKIFKPWNFWTEDADEVLALLKPFDKVTVIYGHVHQLQYNQIGNISFHSMMPTAWPYPYPHSYSQAQSYLPKLTVPMNRADPFFDRDGTGWQFVNLASGKAELYYNLYNNSARTVAFNAVTGEPADATYQSPDARIPPQQHF